MIHSDWNISLQEKAPASEITYLTPNIKDRFPFFVVQGLITNPAIKEFHHTKDFFSKLLSL